MDHKDYRFTHRIVALSALLALFFSVGVSVNARTVQKTKTSTLSHHTRHVTHRKPVKQVAPKSVTVWVNTNTGVYHYPGQRWYGNTRAGQYMTETAALKAGYRPTMNGQ